MDRVRLGMSGLEVSPIAFGTWQLSGQWGEFDESEVIEAIRFARQQGINFFDTAQAYGFGQSEQILGRALRDELDKRRDELVIATKGGLRMDDEQGMVRDSSPEWLRAGVEQSLEALGVEYIDLYQVHWPDHDTPFPDTAQALDALVREGKIRHVGVSNYDVAEMQDFAMARPVETLQPPYSMFRRELEADVLPYAQEHDIGVLVYGPLAHGLLTGAMGPNTEFTEDDWRSQSSAFTGERFQRQLGVVDELEQFAQRHDCTLSQLAIAWVLANPAVDVAIVGSRSAKHIEESIGAADLRLTAADLHELDGILQGAESVLGASPEGVP